MLTFDQWIDAVNARVHARLSSAVRTEELSWDGALWVGARRNAAAAMNDDGNTAKITCDGASPFTVAYREAQGAPEVVGDRIAAELAGKAG
jgi:hypothetical protein